MTLDVYVSYWAMCEDTLLWRAGNSTALQSRDSRRLTREVELEYASRLNKHYDDKPEEFEDWYG